MNQEARKSLGATGSGMDSNSSSSPIFPSEVARAVCGYLTSVGCHSSRATFVEENPELKEFNGLVEKGLIRTVDTDIEGMSLHDIITDYISMKKEIDQLVQKALPEAPQLGLFRSDGPLRKLKLLSDRYHLT